MVWSAEGHRLGLSLLCNGQSGEYQSRCRSAGMQATCLTSAGAISLQPCTSMRSTQMHCPTLGGVRVNRGLVFPPHSPAQVQVSKGVVGVSGPYVVWGGNTHPKSKPTETAGTASGVQLGEWDPIHRDEHLPVQSGIGAPPNAPLTTVFV